MRWMMALRVVMAHVDAVDKHLSDLYNCVSYGAVKWM